ncbi:MAG: alpha/beta hydrolase [Solirubrobacteraceae bacterium]
MNAGGQSRSRADRAIEFASEERIALRGWLRLPAGPGPHPLVIMAHGFGGLKEWTIPEAAEAFVAAGLGALAFDYRNFGDSDGTPREEVDHPGQIADWQSAITFATTLPEIDPRRIGLWGTSLGGRNVLIVGGLERRVRCIVAQVPAIDWADTVLHHQHNATQRQDLLRRLEEDRRDRFLGAEPRYVENQTTPGTETATFFESLSVEQKRNWKARLTLRSYEPTVASSARPFMAMISPAPLRMILVEEDIITPTALQLEAYQAALQPKSLVLLPGRHYDVYASPLKERAIEAAREWLVEHLL